jgi:hypothetical protein
MKVQLSRLFGTGSSEAKLERRSDKQWKRTLLNVLQELDRYLAANVETDEVHRLMLHSGLYAAHVSLEEQDFWPGYAEGITRLALILMGDYPDHPLHLFGPAIRTNEFVLQCDANLHYNVVHEDRSIQLAFI